MSYRIWNKIFLYSFLCVYSIYSCLKNLHILTQNKCSFFIQTTVQFNKKSNEKMISHFFFKTTNFMYT